MTFPRDSIAILWLAWVVYWSIAAIGNKAARQQESAAARIADLVPSAVGVALLLHGFSIGWLGVRFLPWSPAGYWTGLAFVAAGLAFSVWARVHLGGNWSGIVTLKQNHQLVRSGPYRFVRHPIYSGILLALIGTTIEIGQWRAVLGSALVLAAFLRRMVREERLMSGAFPAEYPPYRAATARLIPGFY